MFDIKICMLPCTCMSIGFCLKLTDNVVAKVSARILFSGCKGFGKDIDFWLCNDAMILVLF